MQYLPANPGYYALLVRRSGEPNELFSVVGWRIEDGYQPEPVGVFMGFINIAYPEDDYNYEAGGARQIMSHDDREVYFTQDFGVYGGIPEKGRQKERIISELNTAQNQLRIIQVTAGAGLAESLTEIAAVLIG